MGLNVPVATAMEALYRAPSVLVDGLSRDIGDQMLKLLSDLGCVVTLDPNSAAPIKEAQLFDVALHVSDVARFGDISSALAAFLGTSAEEAGRLLSTPPCIVLGKVSSATIDAMATRLGEGVDLIASDADAALYDVFLASCDASVRARLFDDLRRRGLQPLAEDGRILAGLRKQEADALWSTHQRIKELRVVNRDFLRFDLVMTGGDFSDAAEEALIHVAGIPQAIVPRLFDGQDITVMHAVDHNALPDALERLTAAGLTIRADLVTFLHLGLEITKAPRARDTVETLRAIGVEATEAVLRRLPYRLPYHMPELQARMVREMLERSGAQVEFIDPADPQVTT